MTNEALRNLQAVRAEGQAQQAYLVAVRAEIAELKRQAEQALADANAARATAQAAKATLDTLVTQRAAYTADVEGRKAAELAQLAAAEAEQARLQAVLAEQARKAREAALAAQRAAASAGQPYVPPNAGTNNSGSNYLDYPANGRITSEFGMRFHPILHVTKLHTGTDFGIGCGTPVHATAAGTVISAGWGGGYGNRIMIDHGIQRGVDLVTTYNHLTSFAVRGGSVARGQLIGYSGTTGYSTGCHLHFETLEDGRFVNPRGWI
jgi:murein DD-endopeptidase MepM/ murein hydrolase activator NlpD